MSFINWRKVQERLAELGFDPGPVDGLRGPRTDAALVAFKRSIGFRPRPYLGPLTLKALLDSRDHASESDLPWMDAAADVMGLHEARNRAQLVRWFDKSVSWFDPREVPWCGAFVATCFRKWQPDIALPENPLGARNWARFGEACPATFGAVLVFWRGSRSGWKGHVGFYVGETDTHYLCRGGNQRNAVTDTLIGKDRFLAARWPADHPKTDRKVLVDGRGVPVTTNEA